MTLVDVAGECGDMTQFATVVLEADEARSMKIRTDTAGAAHAPAARALLAQAAGDEFISLGALSGADLCVLGATAHIDAPDTPSPSTARS
jgi:putative Ca2+/H+ antiporter (TMEM165/GDT1 family)